MENEVSPPTATCLYQSASEKSTEHSPRVHRPACPDPHPRPSAAQQTSLTAVREILTKYRPMNMLAGCARTQWAPAGAVLAQWAPAGAVPHRTGASWRSRLPPARHVVWLYNKFYLLMNHVKGTCEAFLCIQLDLLSSINLLIKRGSLTRLEAYKSSSQQKNCFFSKLLNLLSFTIYLSAGDATPL